MTEHDKATLTDEQTVNWRKLLVGMIGPYALIMSKEQIQAYRDKCQSEMSKLESDNA